MILLVAPEGMLGTAFVEALRGQNRAFRTVGVPTLDIRVQGSVKEHIRQADVVINCAAYTQVDAAEEEEAEATRVNGDGVRWLAAQCDAIDAKLVHFSTDYVFPGDSEVPYPVDAQRGPINAYGRSKAQGEVALETSGARHLLLRTSWLYAPFGNNFVRTMRRLMSERDTLQVVDDQHGRPSSAEQLVETTLALLDQGAEGTFHGTDAGACSWFEFSQFIGETLGTNCDLRPCTSDAFPRPAKRPRNSVLDLAKTDAAIGPRRPWQEETARVLERLQHVDQG